MLARRRHPRSLPLPQLRLDNASPRRTKTCALDAGKPSGGANGVWGKQASPPIQASPGSRHPNRLPLPQMCFGRTRLRHGKHLRLVIEKRRVARKGLGQASKLARQSMLRRSSCHPIVGAPNCAADPATRAADLAACAADSATCAVNSITCAADPSTSAADPATRDADPATCAADSATCAAD